MRKKIYGIRENKNGEDKPLGKLMLRNGNDVLPTFGHTAFIFYTNNKFKIIQNRMMCIRYSQPSPKSLIA